jgi:hypothetical protein
MQNFFKEKLLTKRNNNNLLLNFNFNFFNILFQKISLKNYILCDIHM